MLDFSSVAKMLKLDHHASEAASPIHHNVDHHADGVIDRRGRGVVRRSRSVSKGSRTAGPLERSPSEAVAS